MKHNVLIIGSGGREHALGWKLSQSKKVGKLFFAPGNAGTEEIGTNIITPVSNHQEIIEFCKKNSICLVVVAPDDPLAAGMVNDLTAVGIPAFGPTREAAEIEWSKAFAKQLMQEENIPTARFKKFTDYKKARAYGLKQPLPIVVKASGLALGKGVVICKTKTEFETALYDSMVRKIFGDAGTEVVIEEFLEGVEVSFHAFCDGKTSALFPTAQDHKTIYENNQGPNTGGMGTIAPVPTISKKLITEVQKKIINPVLKGLKKRGKVYKGVLYPGLMITKNGPKVLEFNARFGDPETQSYMRLLQTDLFDIMISCINSTLHKRTIRWKNKSACSIGIASPGYPGPYKKDLSISGIESATSEKDIIVFHAGTKKQDKKILTNGGRVLNITAVGKTLDEALKKSYNAVQKLSFPGMQYRKDIGKLYRNHGSSNTNNQ